jgi:tetratricopeptide (TPR) repeat protein
MKFFAPFKQIFSPNHPELVDDAIRHFIGGNYRYFIYKWKFARGLSQWNWAAFFFGPLWFMLRKNYFWACFFSAGIIAGDFYFSTNPCHVTLPLEVMLASGMFANKIYFRKFFKLRETLRRKALSKIEQNTVLQSAGGRDWRATGILVVCLAAFLLLLPSVFGIHLFKTQVRRAEVQSLIWCLTNPEQTSVELALLRQDYQLARLRGEFKRSISVNENSLKLAEFKLGKAHPFAIAMQSDLIDNKLNVGAFRDVLPLTGDMLRQYQLQFGKEHMFIAFMMNNLVSNYLYQGLYDQAKSTCFNALLILEKYSRNETHPVILSNLAAIYSNMAVIQQAYCQYEDAEKNSRDALQLAVQASKGYTIYVCVYLERLGDLYIEQLKLDEAEELYEQAKDIVVKALGPGNPLASSIFLKLGEIRLLRNQFDSAEKFALQAHGLNEKYYGAAHDATAESAYILSRIYLAQGKLFEAEKFAHQSLDAARQAIGAKNVIYGKYLLQMSEVYFIKNNFIETEKMLKDALNLYTATYGENNLRLLDPLEQLAVFYDKTNNRTAHWGIANRIRRVKGGAEEEIPADSKRLTI